MKSLYARTNNISWTSWNVHACPRPDVLLTSYSIGESSASERAKAACLRRSDSRRTSYRCGSNWCRVAPSRTPASPASTTVGTTCSLTCSAFSRRPLYRRASPLGSTSTSGFYSGSGKRATLRPTTSLRRASLNVLKFITAVLNGAREKLKSAHPSASDLARRVTGVCRSLAG